MQQNTENPLVRVEFQQCVQDLQTCHDVCLQTATCAQVTQHCGEECQLMGDTDCANACQNASWSLEQLSKLI